MQSTTIKQEDTSSEDVIQFKLRRKVCKKIRSILYEELQVKLSEAEKYTIAFEQTVFRAYSDNTLEYIQAIKTVCNRVRVGFSHPG